MTADILEEKGSESEILGRSLAGGAPGCWPARLPLAKPSTMLSISLVKGELAEVVGASVLISPACKSSSERPGLVCTASQPLRFPLCSASR